MLRARAASSPTSPPTSPTTPTSSRAATTARSTSGAPTTTATSRACSRLGGARRRPGPLRDPDHAARQPQRGRQARADVASGRATIVTLDDLLDDIGVDAARWFLLQRNHDTTLDLDLELARKRVAGQPRLLRPVRPRADREHPAQGGRGARRGGARRRTWPAATRSSTRRRGAAQAAARVPGGGAGGGRAARAAPADRVRRSRRRRPSRPSTATARRRGGEEGGDEDVRLQRAGEAGSPRLERSRVAAPERWSMSPASAVRCDSCSGCRGTAGATGWVQPRRDATREARARARGRDSRLRPRLARS